MVKLFLDSLKLKIFLSDIVFFTLIKMVLNRRIFGASLPLFEPARLSPKKVLPGVLFLHFFRLSKREKTTELTFSGLVKLHGRGSHFVLLNHIFIFSSLA
jgi:hypothetical protein